MDTYEGIDIYKIIAASLPTKELHGKLFRFILFYKNNLL